jgi:uncharacterized protein (TIGR02118 family)
VLKIVQMIRVAPGVERRAGLDHWTGPHAQLSRAVPGVRRYVQNVASAALHLVGIDPDQPTAFDGYACVWFDDRASYEAARSSPAWAAMADDAAAMFDSTFAATTFAEVDERLIVDGPTGPVKTVWFCRFPDDVRQDAARTAASSQYWTATHGRVFGVKVPGIGRYLQNHVVEPDPARRPVFDGFSECWFEDVDAYNEMNAAPEWDEMNEDAATLFDRDRIVSGWSAALDERVVVG